MTTQRQGGGGFLEQGRPFEYTGCWTLAVGLAIVDKESGSTRREDHCWHCCCCYLVLVATSRLLQIIVVIVITQEQWTTMWDNGHQKQDLTLLQRQWDKTKEFWQWNSTYCCQDDVTIVIVDNTSWIDNFLHWLYHLLLSNWDHCHCCNEDKIHNDTTTTTFPLMSMITTARLTFAIVATCKMLRPLPLLLQREETQRYNDKDNKIKLCHCCDNDNKTIAIAAIPIIAMRTNSPASYIHLGTNNFVVSNIKNLYQKLFPLPFVLTTFCTFFATACTFFATACTLATTTRIELLTPQNCVLTPVHWCRCIDFVDITKYKSFWYTQIGNSVCFAFIALKVAPFAFVYTENRNRTWQQ